MGNSSSFEVLDDLKASMRFLILLMDPRTEDMERLELLEESRKTNINRHQFYQLVKELNKMGIVEDVLSIKRGKKTVCTVLTAKGRKIAKLVIKIRSTLEGE